ncbi:MAG: hypothetical protein ACFFCJ_07555, partial [Promethearchaeota archaeon]
MTLINRYHSLIFMLGVLALLVSFLAVQPLTCTAALVWTDDFDDGNFDDWTISQGDFTAADNSLRATAAGWNFAIHSSTVAYGRWIFDVEATETPSDHFYVYLMSYIGSNYRFSIFTDAFPGWSVGDEFTLLKQQGTTTVPIAEFIPVGDITGWYHFEVHRNNTGYFEVYINGVLRMQVLDNDITQSSTFQFATEIGPGIDNVEIHNWIEEPTTPPPGSPSLPWFIIPVVVVVVLVVILSVILWFRKQKKG